MAKGQGDDARRGSLLRTGVGRGRRLISLPALANVNGFPSCERRRKRTPLVRSHSEIEPVSPLQSGDG
jgi:hypothetical protein